MATKKKLLQAAAGNTSNGYKYLLATSSTAARGFLLYDISDPTSPTLLEHNTSYYASVPGDYDYVHDRMHVMVGSSHYSFTFNTGSIADVHGPYTTASYSRGILADGANGALVAYDGTNFRLYELDSSGKRTGTTILDTEAQAYQYSGYWLDPTNQVCIFGTAASNRIRHTSYAGSTLSATTDYTTSLTDSGCDNNGGVWVDPVYGYVYSYSKDDDVLYSQGPYPATTAVDNVATINANVSIEDLNGTAWYCVYITRDFSMAFLFNQGTTPDELQFIPIDRTTGTFGTPVTFGPDNYGAAYAFMAADEERSLLFLGRASPTDRINIYDYSDLNNVSLVGVMNCQTDSGQTIYNFTNIALAKE